MKLDVRPTLLDRAVSWFDPAAGERRMGARTRMAASAAIFGGSSGYRGAQGDRTKRRGGVARGRSANADTLPGSDRLRAAQRDATMNLPIATAAIGRKTTFTIGSGLMAIPSIDAEVLGLTADQKDVWERRLATDYDAYLTSKDVDAERKATGYGMQGVVHRGALASGDILALRVMPEDQPGRVMATAWKLIEADRLRNPPGVTDGGTYTATGNVIAGGVEIDSYGAPVAYHILQQHPGDLVQRAGTSPIPDRIEAWDRKLALPRVVHVFKKERPEQLRGVGMLATVLEPLRMVSDASDAELYATVMSAMIAVVFKSPGAQPIPEPDFGDGQQGDERVTGSGIEPPAPPSEYRFEPGSVWEIDSDAEVDVKAPGRPNSAFSPFFLAVVQQIGAALGVPAGVLMLMC